MPPDVKPLQVFFPDSTSELLQLYKRYPYSTIYAGGLYIYPKLFRGELRGQSQDVLICLKNTSDLKRMNRTARHIEIGAMVTIQNILDVGRNILPSGLYSLIEAVGPMPIRNIATIGGNLCTPGRIMDLYPAMHIMDAKIELRKPGTARWVPPGKMKSKKGILQLDRGEILTRIRIPMGLWNHYHYDAPRINNAPNIPLISFFGVANIEKETLNDFRVSINFNNDFIFRNKDIEAGLIGRKLPLQLKEKEAFLDSMKSSVNETAELNQYSNIQLLKQLSDLLEKLTPTIQSI
jgi:CO/xanthine dehydrogenase FAD-binding subunit